MTLWTRQLHSRICVVAGAAGIDVARRCGALRSLERCYEHVLTGVPSLGAGDFRCLQSFLIGLLVSEPVGTIQAELSVRALSLLSGVLAERLGVG